MKIAIDLNDVVRDFSNNFLRYYIEYYNHEFDLTNFEFWNHDLKAVFPFNSDASYNNFVYADFPYELFAKCNTCSKNLSRDLNDWTEKIIKDMEIDEKIEVMFVSPFEYGLSIGNTYFFLSKLGTKIREVYLPENQFDIWNKCDVLITANPDLINSKPEGKQAIKILTEYNKECNADYTYSNLSSFLEKEENIKKLL